jgi:ribosomal protein S27AE
MRLLLLGLVAVVVLVMLGVMDEDDTKEPRRCPSCGLEAVYSHYVGHGRPLRWACSQCGHVMT